MISRKASSDGGKAYDQENDSSRKCDVLKNAMMDDVCVWISYKF